MSSLIEKYEFIFYSFLFRDDVYPAIKNIKGYSLKGYLSTIKSTNLHQLKDRKLGYNNEINGKIWIYVGSVNQYRSLEFLKNLDNSCFVSNSTELIKNFKESNIQYLSNPKYWYYGRISKNYDFKTLFQNKYEVYKSLIYRFKGIYESYTDLLQHSKPQAIIMSNDHNVMNRALLRVAKDLNIRVIYLQHAAITNKFPPLEFDLNLLEGQDSLQKYKEAGNINGLVELIGMPKFDNYIPYINQNKNIQSIGIAFNIHDDVDEYFELVNQIQTQIPDVEIHYRFHPSMNPENYTIPKNLIKSDPKIDNPFEFLKKIDLLISGNSSIQLEASLLNIINLSFIPKNVVVEDYYGFIKRGITRLLPANEVVNFIYQHKQNRPNSRDNSKYFVDTVGSDFDGKSQEKVYTIINEFLRNNQNSYSTLDLPSYSKEKPKKILVFGYNQTNFIYPIFKYLKENNNYEFYVYQLHLLGHTYQEISDTFKVLGLSYRNNKSKTIKGIGTLITKNDFLNSIVEAFDQKSHYRVALHRNIYFYNIVEDINKYDVVHIQYCHPNYLYFIPKIDKNIKVLCSIWGSDILKQNNSRLIEIQRKAFKRADLITIQSKELREVFLQKYGEELREKITIIRFGIPHKTYQEIDLLQENPSQLAQYRDDLGLTNDKINVVIGNNRSSNNNHVEVITELSKLDQNIKDKIRICIPFAYGDVSTSYINNLQLSLNNSEIDFIVLEDYLKGKSLAALRDSSDIFIQLPNTDALSGTVMEVLYCGNIVIAGSWLPYNFFKERTDSDTFKIIEGVEQLNPTLTQIINAGFKKFPKNLKMLDSSTINIVPQWDEIYKNI